MKYHMIPLLSRWLPLCIHAFYCKERSLIFHMDFMYTMQTISCFFKMPPDAPNLSVMTRGHIRTSLGEYANLS